MYNHRHGFVLAIQQQAVLLCATPSHHLFPDRKAAALQLGNHQKNHIHACVTSDFNESKENMKSEGNQLPHATLYQNVT